MFDTHCHLNFSRFKKNLPDVIHRANDADVTEIVIPGTDIESSRKAIEIAKQHEGIYAAVGIHPHHVYEINNEQSQPKADRPMAEAINNLLNELDLLISHPKVVAVGEIGIDRHLYEQTKYEQYTVSEKFISTQINLCIEQIKLAVKYNKSLILHNREATRDILKILADNWDKKLSQRTVFHCCEPDERLLSFAKEHKIYMGVDGDITYDTRKQEFIKQVSLDMLVLETDSPFLLPEPLRTRKEFPNEPKNIPVIAEYIAKLTNRSVDKIQKKTTENARRLFYI
ncbi:TatD family hydrolase [Candidatus Roizmanbacteria bacterium]|nr:TatD family hydrolase [Candidatus Roizmanbacteria bacterium]